MALFWLEIERLAKAHHREDPAASEEAIDRYLRMWWSVKFNRPLKDPVLADYSTSELAYEFLRHQYIADDPDKTESAKKEDAADQAWIRQMMEQARSDTKPADVTQTPVQAAPALVRPPPGNDSKNESLPEAPDFAPINTRFDE
jgi:hypothetical protein